jgi:catechol 2,3-dioxygenase-like lactoylglutathione lyase family enzyme
MLRPYTGCMATATFGHLVYFVKAENISFYKTLFGELGWKPGMDEPGFLGLWAPDGRGSMWFMGNAKPVANDYDGPGLNHVGLDMASVDDVKAFATWLERNGVQALFGTPRYHPEFSRGDDVYYQVMFESPDRILFEVAFIGKTPASSS